MQASKNYELFPKRKINLGCHTLIFFMFICSFTQTFLGLLEAFSWYPCFFFRTYPANRQQILKISISRIFSWCNLAISKSRYLKNRAISNFLSGPFRVRDSTVMFFQKCIFLNFLYLPQITQYNFFMLTFLVNENILVSFYHSFHIS